MKLLAVRHVTRYRYRRPVQFGEHRLMFRPRDSHDLRLVSSGLTIQPAAEVRWLHDVFGNSIAIATFDRPGDELVFENTITVEHYGLSEPDYPIEGYAWRLPFRYSADEVRDLGATVERHYADPEGRLDAWARRFLDASGGGDTWAVLMAMNVAVSRDIAYDRREEEGVLTPVEVLARGRGSCRDLALFLMEAARSLGLAARFVTGYLYDPTGDGGVPILEGTGATHAWTQVYLPGAGWVELDPTNGIVGGGNLIRVGVTRDPQQAVPVAGTFTGAREDFLDLFVEVTVRAEG